MNSLTLRIVNCLRRCAVLGLLAAVPLLAAAESRQREQASAALHKVNRSAKQTAAAARAQGRGRSSALRTAHRPRPIRAIAQGGQRQSVKPSATRAAGRAVAPLPPASSQALQRADVLDIQSSVAYVIDAKTREVLVSRKADEVLPIASLTKLMTALVIHDRGLDMRQQITITQDDVDRIRGSHSRLQVGSTLTREALLNLALMSSENRAAHALGRTFPGGMRTFVRSMNVKAAQLGMRSTRYVEPTGLSSDNRSSAHDLALLVRFAATRPLLREWSTDDGATVLARNGALDYRNTNALVRSDDWEIDLQKTGYIREAGRCLVMQAKVAQRALIMVFLDSQGSLTRLGDANRVRKWLLTQTGLGELALASDPA